MYGQAGTPCHTLIDPSRELDGMGVKLLETEVDEDNCVVVVMENHGCAP